MSTAADIVANIRLNNATLGNDVTKANTHLKKLGDGLKALEGPARVALTVIGAMVGIAAREYAKAEAADEGLRAALSATGNEVEGNLARMREFAAALSDSTTMTKAQSKELLTMALNLGISARQATEVVKGGVGLGKALFGGNSQAGVEAYSKALQGNFHELERNIPAVRAAASEAEKLAWVNKKATEGLKEEEEASKTFGGAMKLLKKNAEEAGESVGKEFAPDLIKLATVLQNVIKKFEALTPAQRQTAVRWVEMAAAGAASIIVINKVAGALSVLAAHPIVAMLILAATTFAFLAGEGESAADRISDGFGKMTKGAENFGESIERRTGAIGKYIHLLDTLEVAIFRYGKLSPGASWEAAEKDVDEHEKNREIVREADAKRAGQARKKELDDIVKGEREGLRKLAAVIGDADSVWKAIQLKLLEGTAAGQIAAGKGGGNAPPGAGGAAGGPLGKPGNAPGAAGLIEKSKEDEAKAKADAAHKAALKVDAAIQAVNKLEELSRKLLEAEQRLVGIRPDGIEVSDDPARVAEVRARQKRTAKQLADARVKLADATEGYRKAAGIDPLTDGQDPAKVAARKKRAEKEAAAADKRFENLQKRRETLDRVLGIAQTNPKKIEETLKREIADPANDKRRRGLLEERLELPRWIEQTARERAKLHQQVERGGADEPRKPFDHDTLVPEANHLRTAIQELERQKAAGGGQDLAALNRLEMAKKQQLAETEAMIQAGKGRQNYIETPNDRQDRQLGVNLKDFKESTKNLNGAIETFRKVQDGMKKQYLVE